MASSQRPLLMNDGEHEFVLDLGKARALRPYNEALKNDWRGGINYRYGITDRLNYVLPLMLAYGWNLDFGLQLEGVAGLAGFGWVSDSQRTPSGDPRQPNALVRGIAYTPLLSGVAKFSLDDTKSVLGRIDLVSEFFSTRSTRYSARVGASFIYDFDEWWSLGLGGGAHITVFRDEGVTERTLRLGGGPASLGSTPLLALHLVRSLDLTATTYLEYEMTNNILIVGALLGVDWYFD